VTGTPETITPHRTGLRTAARRLVRELRERPETLHALFDKARTYETLEDALRFRLDYADYLGEEHNPTDVADVRSSLDRASELLLTYEQDDVLRQEAVRQALTTLGERCEDDDQTVAVALLVDIISFTGPQNRLLTMLVRSMAGKTFIDQTIIFDTPCWMARWLKHYGAPSRRESVELLAVLDPVGDPAVLAAASTLWEPLHSGHTYHEAADAIEAARQLL